MSIDVAKISEVVMAVYTVASVLSHVLPGEWAFTKVCGRIALNLRSSSTEPKA